MENLSKVPEKRTPRISIVVPCFNEEDCLYETMDVLIAKLAQLAQGGLILPNSSITFCDDGSSDGTWEIVEKAHQAYPSTIHGILFAANKGKEYAILAGIEEAKDRSDAVICMDADLQWQRIIGDRGICIDTQTTVPYSQTAKCRWRLHVIEFALQADTILPPESSYSRLHRLHI